MSGEGKAPKAAATAKGGGVVSVGANATAGAYPATVRHRKSQVVRAVGPSGLFTVRGQVAKALRALVTAGAAGVTALEAEGWAYRLAAYVHTLRQDYGLSIDLEREPHGRPGQWHGRYRLVSHVTIMEAQP